MSVRTHLRSPLVLVWTLLGIVGVGAVVAAGWQIALALSSYTLLTNPAYLDGLGVVAVALITLIAVLMAAAAVWLPCIAAIAHTVGRRCRGRPSSFLGTLDILAARAEPLYRWAKTRVAIDPIADRMLTENDVAPGEIAVGCAAFVVPALVLDAPTLPSAVERANRIVPRPGRQRIQLAGLGATVILAALGGLAGTYLGRVEAVWSPSYQAFVVAGGILGLGVTIAIDTVWRTVVYAEADRNDGFSQ